MFALFDASNFYASVEQSFRPSLQGRPLVVLSNNDGCAIARSQEAKALGIKMGMNKSAIEQGDSSGAIKLLGPLQELKLPTKAPVADDYYTTQAVLPFSPDPVKLSLGFKGESLSVINIQLPDEAMENKIRAELEGKYGPPKLDDGRKDEQCIYRNGNSFTLKSGVMSVGWTDEETSTTTALNLVHFQSCPSSLSGDMVRTQPSRSLSIQRRPAPAKASGLF